MDSVLKSVVALERFGVLVANILALLGNNQSIERKPRFSFKDPKDAKKMKKGGTSGYITALSGPGDR